MVLPFVTRFVIGVTFIGEYLSRTNSDIFHLTRAVFNNLICTQLIIVAPKTTHFGYISVLALGVIPMINNATDALFTL